MDNNLPSASACGLDQTKEVHVHGDVLWASRTSALTTGPRGHAGITALKSGSRWQIVQRVSNVTSPIAK